jgi:CspA family cold shock protein
MEKGKVKWFSNEKGYGFITAESGKDVFVHHSTIEGTGFKSLDENQEVEFESQEGPKSRSATKVIKI